MTDRGTFLDTGTGNVIRMTQQRDEILWLKTTDQWWWSEGETLIRSLRVIHDGESLSKDRGVLDIFLGHRSVFRAPVTALMRSSVELGQLEEYFAPRAMWFLAEDLLEAAKEPTQQRLQALRSYIEGVRNEYLTFLSVTSPLRAPLLLVKGEILRAEVSRQAGDRVSFVVELAVTCTEPAGRRDAA